MSTRIIKHPEQRVAVFIDTQNLYHSARHLYRGARVNFGELVKSALGPRKLVRAIAYVVNTEEGEEQAFFDALTKAGIEVKTKDLQIFADGAKKADWDVGMAIDAVRLAPKVDAIVIATGDGDFVPLAEYVRSNGTQIECITFGRSASRQLRESVDDFIDMDEEPKHFLVHSRRRRKK